MSQITVVGNLTAAPELRYTQSGLPVASFTVAVNRGKDDKKETDFHRCQVWREMAEHVAALEKGTRVVATGTLKQRSFETREGEKRQSWEIDVFALGSDLRFATAQVTRTDAGTPREASSPTPANSEPSTGGWAASDETPF